MAIIVDKDGNIVTVENEPEEARAMFPNIKEGDVSDVTLPDGTSIVNGQGVGELPIAMLPASGDNAGNFGLVALKPGRGIGQNINDKSLLIAYAGANDIKSGTDSFKPLTPTYQQNAVFFGLSKAAGVDLRTETVTVGNYPESSKVAIQQMLGVYDEPYRKITERTITEETENIDVFADDSSKPFSLTEVIILFENILGDTSGSAGIAINTNVFDSGVPYLTVSSLYNVSTAQTRSAKLSVRGGRLVGCAVSSNMPDAYTTGNVVVNRNAAGFKEVTSIERVVIGALNAAKFVSGKITIYGK